MTNFLFLTQKAVKIYVYKESLVPQVTFTANTKTMNIFWQGKLTGS